MNAVVLAIVLVLLADSSALKLYAQMKNQWPRPRWPCECCGGEVLLCWGDVRQPYLRHVIGSDCAGGGEGALHRLAKEGLADYLETGERVTFTDGRRCSGCNELYTRAEQISTGGSVQVEYGLPDGGRADIALLSAAGEVEAVIEIMDSHATESARPEPWYEVSASTVFKLLNATATANLGRNRMIMEKATLPPLLCEKMRAASMPLKLPRRDNRGVLRILQSAYTCSSCTQKQEMATRERGQRLEAEKAARRKEDSERQAEQTRRAERAGRPKRQAYEKLRATWDSDERKAWPRKRQLKMLIEVVEAINDWRRAEVKAGASDKFWGMDRQVSVYDTSLLEDWKELGRKKLTFGKFKGRTYLEIQDPINEVHGGKSYEDLMAAQLRFEETASTYCGWVRSVEDPQSGLADFQLWLEGDPETAWNEFYVDQYD